MRKAIAGIVSRWLCPEVHLEAQRYRRLSGQLEDAVQWLGAKHPEGAAVAQWALDKDHWYWTSTEPFRCPSWRWQPPEYVGSIQSLRWWLESQPFAAAVE